MTKDNPYPKDHKWCGCPDCIAECLCSLCTKSHLPTYMPNAELKESMPKMHRDCGGQGMSMYKDAKEAGFVKDYCAGCEYPELLHMMLPRIDELEKKLTYQDRQIEHCNMIISDQAKIIKELEKRVKELEFNQSLIASERLKKAEELFALCKTRNDMIIEAQLFRDAKPVI